MRGLGLCLALALGLAAAGCNRTEREVTVDLTLREVSQGGRTQVVAEPGELYVPEGTQVRVLLHNAAPGPHQLVLVQPGHVEDVLSAAAAPAADKTESLPPFVLARSPWVAPQTKQAARFAAPTAGHYEFTCPCGTQSHPQPLRGKLIVQ